jgi:molybdenum cofactor cytidylyltransferase
MTSGIILLAAGSSSRMGRSKQLLSIKGKSLLSHSTDIAVASKADAVVVVLGSRHDIHAPVLRPSRAHLIVNEEWETGIGSSIKAGLTYLLTLSGLQCALIMVVDQPFLQTAHLDNLLSALEISNQSIAASWYDNTPGVPAAFKSKHFPELLTLGDNEGAKKMLLQYKDSLIRIPFDKGSADLDTLNDYEEFTK